MSAIHHDIIVVDDNPKFFHHVWRNMTQAFEYGFTDGASTTGDTKPLRRTAPDGLLSIEWHDPRCSTQAQAKRLLETFERRITDLESKPGHQVWALIDVYGVGMPGTHQWQDYARSFLAAEERRERLRVVSSYSRHIESIDVDAHTKVPLTLHPKSPEMLWTLRNEIRTQPLPAPSRSREHEALHVLVTGAGFELTDRRALGRGMGIPPTPELLRMGGATNDERGGYPVPEHWKKHEELGKAAKAKDLDGYWEWRLRVGRGAVADDAHPDPDVRNKIDVVELADRESFRAALVQYDVGHLAQTLWAAQLDWAAWLTTNYTQFADRAIAFVGRTGATADERPWRRVPTTLELNALPRPVRDAVAANARWLIKLHGDIGHTQSMALATSDKQSSSRLSVKPGLAEMYAFGEELLLGRLEASASANAVCHWHVVGHALRDKPLSELLQHVQSRSAGHRHVVTVVAPDAEDVVKAALKERRLVRPRGCKVRPLSATATEYLAHVRAVGLPHDDEAYEALLERVTAAGAE